MKHVFRVIIMTFVLFIIFISCLYFQKKFYQYKVSQFDINGDGIYSISEQTAEWSYWNTKLITDGGLAFIIPFLVPLSLLLSIFFYIIFYIIKRLMVRFRKLTKKGKNKFFRLTKNGLIGSRKEKTEL